MYRVATTGCRSEAYPRAVDEVARREAQWAATQYMKRDQQQQN